MASATSSEFYSEARKAWWNLNPQEQEVILTYHDMLKTNDVDKMLMIEVLHIEDKHPNLCPILSVPDRFLKG